jgi:hypothetical protein
MSRVFNMSLARVPMMLNTRCSVHVLDNLKNVLTKFGCKTLLRIELLAQSKTQTLLTASALTMQLLIALLMLGSPPSSARSALL